MTFEQLEAVYADGKLATVQDFEWAMALLVDLWNTLPEGSDPYKAASVLYGKFLIRKNNLLKESKGPKPDGLVLSAAKMLLDEVCTSNILAVSVEDVDPVVKAGHAKSLQEVLGTIFAVHRQMALAAVSPKIVDQEVLAVFTLLLDQKIKVKIETRLKGSKGKAYIEAYAKACAKHGMTQEPTQTTGPDVAVVAPKTTKKKTKKDAPSTWFDVEESVAVVPTTTQGLGPAVQGLLVKWISSQVCAEMAKFMDEEKARWAEQGVECSDVLLRHNFLTMLFADWGQDVYRAVPCEAGKVAVWKTGEPFPESLDPIKWM